MKKQPFPLYFVEPRENDSNFTIWRWLGENKKSEPVPCADGREHDMYVCNITFVKRLKKEWQEYGLLCHVFVQKNGQSLPEFYWSSIPQKQEVEGEVGESEMRAREELAPELIDKPVVPGDATPPKLPPMFKPNYHIKQK